MKTSLTPYAFGSEDRETLRGAAVEAVEGGESTEHGSSGGA